MAKALSLLRRLCEEDNILACAWCQKELGIQSKRNETHGVCRRHSVEMLVKQLAMTPEAAEVYLNQKPRTFAPDLKSDN